MTDGDDRYEYSVAWIDLMATRCVGGPLDPRPRSLRPRRRARRAKQQARPARLPRPRRSCPCRSSPRRSCSTPSRCGPSTRSGTARRPRRRRGHVATIPAFFHPLDAHPRLEPRLRAAPASSSGSAWCRSRAGETMRHIIEAFSASATDLARQRAQALRSRQRGHAVVPAARLDAVGRPVGRPLPGSARLLDRLDEQVLAVGGRLYLAKDSRMRPSHAGGRLRPPRRVARGATPRRPRRRAAARPRSAPRPGLSGAPVRPGGSAVRAGRGSAVSSSVSSGPVSSSAFSLRSML